MAGSCARLMILTFIGAQTNMKKLWWVFIFIVYGFSIAASSSWVMWATTDRSPIVEEPDKLDADLASIYDSRHIEKLNSEKDHFTFSPDKQYIGFLENIFEGDYTHYTAFKVYEPLLKQEKTLLIDNYHLSNFEWLNNTTARVYHSAGTGVRVYRDVDVRSSVTFVADDQLAQNIEFWTPDLDYAKQVRGYTEAWLLYRGAN